MVIRAVCHTEPIIIGVSVTVRVWFWFFSSRELGHVFCFAVLHAFTAQIHKMLIIGEHSHIVILVIYDNKYSSHLSVIKASRIHICKPDLIQENNFEISSHPYVISHTVQSGLYFAKLWASVGCLAFRLTGRA